MNQLIKSTIGPALILGIFLTIWHQFTSSIQGLHPMLRNDITLALITAGLLVPFFWAPKKTLYRTLVVVLSAYFIWDKSVSAEIRGILSSFIILLGISLVIFKVIQNKKVNDNKKQKKESAKNFYRSPEWRRLRLEVLREHNFTCEECGIKEDQTRSDGTVAKMHGEHRLPRSKYPELALTKANIGCLCDRCNIQKSDRATEEEVELYRNGLRELNKVKA